MAFCVPAKLTQAASRWPTDRRRRTSQTRMRDGPMAALSFRRRGAMCLAWQAEARPDAHDPPTASLGKRRPAA